jgi:arylsulfatase
VRRILTILACAAALVALACKPPLARGRWNVVVVLVDTLRADHLGAYGYRRPTSPAFDALAQESYLFTDARAQASCTFPSVNSILTSRYPARFLGQPDKAMGIPAAIPSVAELLAARGWSTAAVSASAIVRRGPTSYNRHGGFDRGFGRFDEECLWKDAACVTRRGLAAIARQREPFFTYLHYIDPHGPYDPPKEQRRRLRSGRATQEWVKRGNPMPIAQQLDGRRSDVRWTPHDVRFLEGLYDGEIAFVDQQIGALVDALREQRLLDRTILVVLADHGESFLEHGSVRHCVSVYDSEVKTPLLVRLPRQRGGARLAGPVENLDLVPTLFDLMGLPVEGQGFEGTSLVPRLEGKEAGDRASFAMINARRAVAAGPYKLVADFGKGEWHLFDVTKDPAETRDLKAEAREPFARLRTRLGDWMGRVEGKDGVRQSQEAERELRALGYL